MATGYVNGLGTRTEVIQPPTRAWLGADGSVCLEVTAEYWSAPRFLQSKGIGGKVLYSRRRFLVGTPDLVAKIVAANLCPNKEDSRRHAHLWFVSWPPDPREQDHWQLYPADMKAPDAEMADLPPPVRRPIKQSEKRGDRLILAYPMAGPDMDIHIDVSFSGPPLVRREWWGYALQVFLIPAIPFDIATFPIQFPLGLYLFFQGDNWML